MDEGDKIISFLKEFTHISIFDLGKIMEILEDDGYFSKEGKDFKKLFQEAFMKKI